MNHYTYLLRDPVSGMKYIGVRSCKCEIEDDSYKGSSYAMTPENKENCEKTILGVFDTRIEANQHEMDLHKHFDAARNPEFWNMANANNAGYDVTSYVPTNELRERLSKQRKGIPRTPETIEKLKIASQKRYAEGRGVPLKSYKRGEEHYSRKHTSTYRWANTDGSEFIGTNLEIRDHLNIKHIQNVTKLLLGINIQLNGWCIVENLTSGCMTTDTTYVTKRNWINTITSACFCGTGAQLVLLDPALTMSQVNKLLRKDRNTANGWKLID